MKNNKCAHHWVIDPPDGPTSQGHCKLCGAEKAFPNQVKGPSFTESSRNMFPNAELRRALSGKLGYTAISESETPE